MLLHQRSLLLHARLGGLERGALPVRLAELALRAGALLTRGDHLGEVRFDGGVLVRDLNLFLLEAVHELATRRVRLGELSLEGRPEKSWGFSAGEGDGGGAEGERKRCRGPPRAIARVGWGGRKARA